MSDKIHPLDAIRALEEGSALKDRIEALERERDEARGLVTEANNSLYGSQGYFHSLNGGPYDKYHLASGIENLKSSCRAAERKVAELEADKARLSEALRTLLDCPDIADNDHKDEETHAAERVARAALSGSGSGWREPDGWKLVPVELTNEMKERVRSKGGPQALAFAIAAWPDLLSAAPQQGGA